jgi:hypothetical protein
MKEARNALRHQAGIIEVLWTLREKAMSGAQEQAPAGPTAASPSTLSDYLPIPPATIEHCWKTHSQVLMIDRKMPQPARLIAESAGAP